MLTNRHLAEIRERADAATARQDVLDLLAHIDELTAIARKVLSRLDHYADGSVIFPEDPCWTPDGRAAWVNNFSSTPIAVIKHDDGTDEEFEARECFSSKEAVEAAQEERQHRLRTHSSAT